MSIAENTELSFSRVFDAPRALVWQAWTDPQHIMQWWGPQGFNNATCTIALAPHGKGTRYTATVIHADEPGCQRHAAMGYEQGWGKALEQMVSLISTGHI